MCNQLLCGSIKILNTVNQIHTVLIRAMYSVRYGPASSKTFISWILNLFLQKNWIVIISKIECYQYDKNKNQLKDFFELLFRNCTRQLTNYGLLNSIALKTPHNKDLGHLYCWLKKTAFHANDNESDAKEVNLILSMILIWLT